MAQILCGRREIRSFQIHHRPKVGVFVHKFPQAAKELSLTVHTGVVPFKGLIRRSCKHHRSANGVCSVHLEQMLRITGITCGFRHLLAVLQHHAEHQKTGKGFIGVHHAGITQQLVIKACIQEVQDRMFDSTHVVIHRRPVVDPFIKHRLVRIWAGKTRVIPRRFHECIEGIRFASGLPAATRATGIEKTFQGGQR